MAKGFKTGGKNFQKGVVTNPAGRPPLSPEIKEARRLTQTRFIELTNQYINMSKEELKAAEQNPKTTILELMVLKVMQHAIAKGDQLRLNFILERLIGKVPTPIDMDVSPEALEHLKMLKDKSNEELLEIWKQMTQSK